MSMRNSIIFIVIIGFAIAAIFFFMRPSSDTVELNSQTTETETREMEQDTDATDTQQDAMEIELEMEADVDTSVSSDTEASVHTVRYTGNGFSPESITVAAGDTVIWVNESSNQTWPASANHPTHTVYPGSSIQSCDTDQADTTFDACEPIESGGSYSFQFNELGEWEYHNHLRSNEQGMVTVVETLPETE